MLNASAAFWDRLARKYAAHAIADPAGFERTLARVGEALRPEQVAAEFGCGTGTVALRLAPLVRHYHASDFAPGMIGIAREKAAAAAQANLSLAVEGPEACSLAPGSVDVALALNLLHLIEGRTAALAGIAWVLRPGGLFISKTPCLSEMKPWVRLPVRVLVPLARLFGKAPYVDFFSAARLEADIVDAGFEIIETARHGSNPRNDIRLFVLARKR